MHPLQTLTRERGPEQLDGAWGAISAETDDALARARWLAETLGLRPFEVADADRTLYHAAAVIGGNFLVTLHDVAARLLEQVGAPPEAIVPLMTRTIENGFDLTGPIARGDWTTVEAHLAALEERDAGPRAAVPGAGGGDAAVRIVRTVAEVREALREPRGRGERIGLVPTMGAFHAGHIALMRAAREASDVVVVSLFVNPAQFNAADDLARYPRDEAAGCSRGRGGGRRRPLRAIRRRALPRRVRHLGRPRLAGHGCSRGRPGRATSAG